MAEYRCEFRNVQIQNFCLSLCLLLENENNWKLDEMSRCFKILLKIIVAFRTLITCGKLLLWETRKKKTEEYLNTNCCITV